MLRRGGAFEIGGFCLGWCYNLAIAGEDAGIGVAKGVAKECEGAIVDPLCHAVIQRESGWLLDICGYHPNTTVLQEKMHQLDVVPTDWQTELV